MYKPHGPGFDCHFGHGNGSGNGELPRVNDLHSATGEWCRWHLREIVRIWVGDLSLRVLNGLGLW